MTQINIGEVQEDPDEMKGRNHDAPSDTDVQVEEPSSVRSSKRIRQMVICELSKMKPLSQRERFKAMDIITSNPRHVTILWGLDEEERLDSVMYMLHVSV